MFLNFYLILEGKVNLLLGGGGGQHVNPGALWVRSYLAGRSQCKIVAHCPLTVGGNLKENL